jgi:hypothetical protein
LTLYDAGESGGNLLKEVCDVILFVDCFFSYYGLEDIPSGLYLSQLTLAVRFQWLTYLHIRTIFSLLLDRGGKRWSSVNWIGTRRNLNS